MHKIKQSLLAIGLTMLSTNSAFTQDLIIYPAQGQSPEQIEQDKSDCAVWAKSNTGFDPMQASTAQQPATEKKRLVGGAAKGAAAGAIIGAIAGDAGQGAAIGAGAGAVGRGIGNRRAQAKAEEAAAQEQANLDEAKSNYNRAYSVCLEGKGYNVK